MKQRKKILIAGMLGLLTGFCNGFFGAGGGIIVVPTLVYILKFESHRAHATALAVILPISLISAFIYFKADAYDWALIAKLMVGGIIGSVLGSKLLGKLSSKWLRRIFAIFIILAAIRMII
ncbi:MAG: sulfite exporter TauE/SafE family protein [Clostridiales bacterium]|nr:sulfite exporter TauE/SafE family protein [Clostridiales bacterium]